MCDDAGAEADAGRDEAGAESRPKGPGRSVGKGGKEGDIRADALAQHNYTVLL